MIQGILACIGTAGLLCHLLTHLQLRQIGYPERLMKMHYLYLAISVILIAQFFFIHV